MSFYLLLLLSFVCGVLACTYFHKYKKRNQKSVSSEYFKGLNYLLNEEPDKAIEAFIKVLEVDGETVELHLALGGLFRRKGEVDRATRIHQNLISRQDLSEFDHSQAIYALAQDYNAAGLFDRAENLFTELLGSSNLNSRAIEGLLNIYHKQKDWSKAIEVIGALKSPIRQRYDKNIAHYWCELAEIAMCEERFDDADVAIKKAILIDRRLIRAVYLSGELNYQKEKYTQAIKVWRKLDASWPFMFKLLQVKLIDSYRKVGDEVSLKRYLSETTALPVNTSAFKCWLKAIEELFSKEEQDELFYGLIVRDGINQAAATQLYLALQCDQLSFSHLKLLANLLLTEAKKRNIEYTCEECGFNVSAPHWQCPSCGEWDSFV